MAENTLVEGLWADSVELIKKLDEGEYSPTLAVWYFYADAEQWRLLIGGPAYDALLPKQEPLAYQRISEAISSCDLTTLSISLVKLVKLDAPLAKALKFLVGTGEKGLVQATFSNTTLNGIFIKDMVVMRSA